MTSDFKGFTRFAREKIAREHRELEREWYAKLKASGFDDIEPYDNAMNTRMIGHWHTTMQYVKRGVFSGNAEKFRLFFEWLDVTRYRHGRKERWLCAGYCEGFDWAELVDRFGVDVTDAKLRVQKQLRHCLKTYGIKVRTR